MTPKEIKELRTRANLTQQQLARIMRVTARCIGKWENGEAKPGGPAKVLLERIGNNPDEYIKESID